MYREREFVKPPHLIIWQTPNIGRKYNKIKGEHHYKHYPKKEKPETVI